MRFFAIVFFLALLVPGLPTSAQVGGSITDITGESVSIVLDPQYPNPGDQVTATIDDYAFNGGGANITWFFDGLSAPNVSNSRTITFTAPAVDTTMTIIARLEFQNGKTLEARRVIKPLYLDLIIEPQTYTPLFYKGRALPTKGSVVNINALLQNKNGPVNSTDYSYSWTLNNKSVYGGARIGGNWGQIIVPHGQSSTITISVQDKSGTTVARKLVAIPTVELDVQLYEIRSLLGLGQKAISGDFIITGNSASIKAVPYYLDTRAVSNNLFTEWSINNQPIVNEGYDPFEINLERGTAGSAQIGFKVRNLSELLQSDETSIRVKL
ncbi:hypothetical protein K2P47_05065 [Patescibacteria group bacterium]|nr:hypothetical protein [Patescibacteria group bacterium]